MTLIKIGNFRLAFGKSTNRTSGGSANSPQSSTVVFPTGFFTSAPTCVVSAGGPLSSVATQVANVSTITDTTLTYYQFTTSGSGSAVVQWTAMSTV